MVDRPPAIAPTVRDRCSQRILPGATIERWIDAGSGDIIMTLPDQSYALAAQAPDGGVFNDGIRVDPRSPHRVAIDAGSGEVRLEPSG